MTSFVRKAVGSWGRELGPSSLWESNKIFLWWETRSEKLLSTRSVSARFHSSSFPDDPYCFRQVTGQSQIKITSVAPTPAGSALTETGSSWFSNQQEGIRTSLTYCWEGWGCACGSGQPWSVAAVLCAEPSVERLTAESCFQVLLQYRGRTVAAPVTEEVSLSCFSPSACGMGWQQIYAFCLLLSHGRGCKMLFPLLGTEKGAHFRGRTANGSCAALCSLQGLNG